MIYTFPMPEREQKKLNPLYEEIGKNISRYRKELSFSQAELAPKIGISQQHLASIEVGVRRIAIEDLLKVCKVLHVSIHQILPIQEPEKKPGPRPKLAVAAEKLSQLPEKDQAVVIAMIDSLFAAQPKE